MSTVDGEEEPLKRTTVNLEMLQSKTLTDFATKNSAALFKNLRLPEDFLKVGSDQWNDNTSFKMAKEFVSTLVVTNNHAERGVALFQEFSGRLTKDEE